MGQQLGQPHAGAVSWCCRQLTNLEGNMTMRAYAVYRQYLYGKKRIAVFESRLQAETYAERTGCTVPPNFF